MSRLFSSSLIGAILFGAFRYLQPGNSAIPAPLQTQVTIPAASPGPPPSRQIVLTLDQLTRLATVFAAQWGREPTSAELDRLVEAEVKEEILYREGLALGLDKDDEIVRRRMAQKMQFLAEDVAASHRPTDAELKAWFDQNAKLFEEPARLSFRHLYFSPDRRGANAEADAGKALTEVKGEPQDVKFAGADPFMFQDFYRDKTAEYLGKEFGPPFAAAVEKLPAGLVAGADPIGLRLASGVRRHRHSGPRARLRGDRAGREAGLARRPEGKGGEEGLRGHAGQIHRADAGPAARRRSAAAEDRPQCRRLALDPR